jgi:osmotically-inducible protein OsmY
MRFLTLTAGFVLMLALSGCSASNRERAREQGDQDLRKATDDARRAGHEIKEDAKELSRRVDVAVKPDGEPVSEKVAHAEAVAKADAARAGVQLDKAALLAKVKTKLLSDAGLSTLANVDVAVNGSVVTLSGTVANESQRKAAQTAAAGVDGVSTVQNQLVVRP